MEQIQIIIFYDNESPCGDKILKLSNRMILFQIMNGKNLLNVVMAET